MRIARLSDLPDGAGMRAQIEAVFFGGAATKEFADEAARSAYLDLWLGRYLRHFPDMAHVAHDGKGRVAAYLAGSPVSDRPPLPGPDYYALFPDRLTADYPAHIHVNVHEDFRGRGIGAALAAAFRDECARRGLPGLHAVTLADSPAARFFERCGLTPAGTALRHGRRLAFLAQRLGPPA